jgi:DNA-binding response OmpR family regulator
MRLLIIDDEPGLRQTVSLLLKEEGYEVDTASDGEEGLARALDLQPGIILCDCACLASAGWSSCSATAPAAVRRWSS